jgi:hypothetical protein
VALGLEAKRGAVIHALPEYPWLTIYPLNPVPRARYRQAFTPSGASDDRPEARLLLELGRDHAARLRPPEPQAPQTLQLSGLGLTQELLFQKILARTSSGVAPQQSATLRYAFRQPNTREVSG